MRKSNCLCFFDIILWFLIYSLPLLVILFCSFKGDIVSISSAFSSLGLNVVSDNIVYTALVDLFGSSGVLPLIADNGILLYFSYFIICNIVHLAIDVLLFIVRLSHEFLENGLNGGVKW